MSTRVARRAGPLLRKCITSCNHILREILVYLGHPTRQVYNNFWRHSRMPDLAGIVIKLFFFKHFILASYIMHGQSSFRYMHFVLLMNDGKVDGKNVFLSVNLEPVPYSSDVSTTPLKFERFLPLISPPIGLTPPVESLCTPLLRISF